MATHTARCNPNAPPCLRLHHYRPTRRSWLLLWPTLLLVSLLALLLFTTAMATPSATPGEVHAQEFGEEWPFTVEHGLLHCDDSGAVSFETEDGARYALNSAALTQGLPAPLPIWKADPQLPEAGMMSLAPLIAAGAALQPQPQPQQHS